MLALVLYEYPKLLTFRDLREEIGDGTDSAILDLRVAGLVTCDGDLVRPTWAALSYYRLELP